MIRVISTAESIKRQAESMIRLADKRRCADKVDQVTEGSKRGVGP